jgi:N-ethylmaleimide reductase
VERRAPVSIRVFPLGGFNGVDNGEDQEAAGLYLIGELAKRNLAYLHLSEPDWAGGKPLRDEFREAIRAAYPGVISSRPVRLHRREGEGLIGRG